MRWQASVVREWSPWGAGGRVALWALPVEGLLVSRVAGVKARRYATAPGHRPDAGEDGPAPAAPAWSTPLIVWIPAANVSPTLASGACMRRREFGALATACAAVASPPRGPAWNRTRLWYAPARCWFAARKTILADEGPRLVRRASSAAVYSLPFLALFSARCRSYKWNA